MASQQGFNPIQIAEAVEERYRQYLRTTFYFRDPELRRSFEEALESGHLSRGPFLEATPVFKRGVTPRVLATTILADESPDKGFLAALNADRPLYQHQEESIRKVSAGRNVIVATGTGSGKTEAFLYPILFDMYKEFKAGTLGPGVRALILYPMNALANDQRERLGQICAALRDTKSAFQFTFGQYIGDTPNDERDSRRNASEHIAHRNPGELVLRSEMRKNPPNILLTNFSMLEYLLLRPADSELFDNGRAKWWKYLVLDEVHQYRGSQGIEMAMLIRRLKQRLRVGGRKEEFGCIATSATLVGEEGASKKVAKFAWDLFGEEFEENDLIVGEQEALKEPSPVSLGLEDYKYLKALLEGGQAIDSRLHKLFEKCAVSFNSEQDLFRSLAALLERDSRSYSLRRLITGNPLEIRDIADQVCGDIAVRDRVPALAELVSLLMTVSSPQSQAPLLSARYHLFLRSLEGAFVSYWPHKRVFLDRKDNVGGSKVFEVALCRECGQHYFVGREINGALVEAVRDPSQSDFGVTFYRPVENDLEQNDEDELFDENKKIYQLCLQCGKIKLGKPPCDHASVIIVVKEDPPTDDNRADQVVRCGACGYAASGRDPVREVVHGTDGPHAVIATTLHQILPTDRKKILAFADGRQEAAFFAWYLEESYNDILSRNLFLKALQSVSSNASSGLSLSELAIVLGQVSRERKVFPSSIGDLKFRHEIWRRLYREFLTTEPRISLEGVGLIQWVLKWPDHILVPPELKAPPWSLTDDDAKNLIAILLDFVRMDRGVELLAEGGISLNWDDLGLQATHLLYKIGPPGKKFAVRSWDGKNGKRARFLAKLLVKQGMPHDKAVVVAGDTLRIIWEAIRKADTRAAQEEDRLLLPANDGCRLNPNWYRAQLILDNKVFRCNTCGRIQPYFFDICTRPTCHGAVELVQATQLGPNHYRLLYEADLPATLRVEEHTAQLDNEKAREYQRDFKEGKIHVLSSSTTFELGVDLGDLNTIFLRNVPPEAFNYSQRVGRAGRRVGFPGFAITYCKRSPHDLYHFSEPLRMISGKSRAPIISLSNEKIITRHVTATAISFFLRAHREKFKNVESLFGDLLRPGAATEITAFLQSRRSEMEETLRAIVPQPMWSRIGMADGSWIQRSIGSFISKEGKPIDSRFLLAEKEVSEDVGIVMALEEESKNRGDYKTAEWAKRRADTIKSEDVLSFLSRKAVIPKYGFPVDVVELDTQRIHHTQESAQVLLQRDLSIAISEFAPSGQVIANKRTWTSYGLKKVAAKEWPQMLYKRCAKHNVFIEWEKGKHEPDSTCSDTLPVGKYVIPQFGFVTDRDKPKDPTGRPGKVFSTRPYFAHSLSDNPGIITIGGSEKLLTLKKASPGLMVVLCEGKRGQGFYICQQCGAGFTKRPKEHRTPFGRECNGVLEHVALGHEFVTDVLKLQFHAEPPKGTNPVWFAYSLSYALVEGAAEVLEIPANDLSATVAHSDVFLVPEIVIFDDVPGGAGLVARLEEESILKECLSIALRRVSGGCGCDTSCYGCLRGFRNQFAHQYLRRVPVMEYLDGMLSRWQ